VRLDELRRLLDESFDGLAGLVERAFLQVEQRELLVLARIAGARFSRRLEALLGLVVFFSRVAMAPNCRLASKREGRQPARGEFLLGNIGVAGQHQCLGTEELGQLQTSDDHCGSASSRGDPMTTAWSCSRELRRIS